MNSGIVKFINQKHKAMTKKITNILTLIFLIFLLIACNEDQKFENYNELKSGFIQPPDSARPGVYWYFMDGNLSKEGMTKDLESMKKAGIGQVVFLEVNVGVPRGEVDFMSEEWLDHFEHMVRETERLGITITLGVGPGWTGSGGPWVKGNESMRHLVASKTTVKGGTEVQIELAIPEPKDPYFGLHQFPEPIRERWEEYYEDVAVLVFPAPKDPFVIDNIEKKALYYREPYTSKPGVKPFIPTKAEYKEL